MKKQELEKWRRKNILQKNSLFVKPKPLFLWKQAHFN